LKSSAQRAWATLLLLIARARAKKKMRMDRDLVMENGK
jgi:hypothetical protein